MTKAQVKRSPFFFVGDKYKLIPQLSQFFPDDISTYIEPFVGGGSSLINVNAQSYIANDINEYVVGLHKALSEYTDDPQSLLDKLFGIIEHYRLSCSYQGKTVPDELKRKYVKTYYSHYNKAGYLDLRNDYNADRSDMLLLYILLIFGFNHVIRFNSAGSFNLPVDNVDFNKNVYNALIGYLGFMKEHKVAFCCLDYKEFLSEMTFDSRAFVYLDPPHLISASEYNKLWNEAKEAEMYEVLDELDKRGVRFGVSNLLRHKGQENPLLLEWSKKYKVFEVSSNYISFNDNTVKKNSAEVYVTNYEKD